MTPLHPYTYTGVSQVFDHEEWNAWHYGDKAYQKDPITRCVRVCEQSVLFVCGEEGPGGA